MIPTRDFITARIPPPRNTCIFKTRIQTSEDIVKCVMESVYMSDAYCKNYAYIFADSGSILQTCNDIWGFLRENFKFKPEGSNLQTGRSVRYIIYDPVGMGKKSFDCKHFSTFAYATCRALNIKSELRLCGYTNSGEPTHVYCIANDKQGNEITIDGTLPVFNRESNSKFKVFVREKTA